MLPSEPHVLFLEDRISNHFLFEIIDSGNAWSKHRQSMVHLGGMLGDYCSQRPTKTRALTKFAHALSIWKSKPLIVYQPQIVGLQSNTSWTRSRQHVICLCPFIGDPKHGCLPFGFTSKPRKRGTQPYGHLFLELEEPNRGFWKTSTFPFGKVPKRPSVFTRVTFVESAHFETNPQRIGLPVSLFFSLEVLNHAEQKAPPPPGFTEKFTQSRQHGLCMQMQLNNDIHVTPMNLFFNILYKYYVNCTHASNQGHSQVWFLEERMLYYRYQLTRQHIALGQNQWDPILVGR